MFSTALRRPAGFCLIAMLVLVPAIIMAGCARPNPTNTIYIAGSTSVQLLSEELANAFMRENPEISVNVSGGGSSAGIKAAREGTADVGSSSRELKSEEKKGLREIPIAIDGIALVVNPANKVSGLSLDEVRRIYTGEITNWKEVGGEDDSINALTREEGSGTRGAFEEIVMKGSHISSRVGVQNTTGSLRTAVAGDPRAIAYISLGNVNNAVKVVAVDGILPGRETVRNGSYKLVRPFLYLTGEQPRELVKRFIDFVLSPEGQRIVGESFIPVK